MANVTLTNDLALKEAQVTFRNNTQFVNTLTPQYDGTYQDRGTKAGASLRLAVPKEFTVGSGATLSTQDNEEKAVTFTKATQNHIGVVFTSAELTQDLSLISKTIIAPAMATLASSVENQALSNIYKDVYQAPTIPSSTLDRDDVLGAGVELDLGTAPRDGQRCTIFEPRGMSEMVSDSSALFNPSQIISSQYEDGIFNAPALGFKVAMTNNVASHTTGLFTTGSTPLMNGSTSSGATSIVTDGWAFTTAIFKEGDIITIAGVNSVNPLTKQSNGELQKFVVTTDITSTGGGAATIPVSPEIISTGSYQNVDALPADNAAIVPYGVESTPYRQALSYHPNFATFGTCDLELPVGKGAEASRSVEDGISMRIASQYDITTDKTYTRFDILHGSQIVVPRWGARIYS